MRPITPKISFLSIVSHELRTPLTAILAWVQVMRRASTAEKREAALAIIERSGRAQAVLIDDLLDTSRISAGKLRIEMKPVDLREVVRQTFSFVLPTAQAKGVEVMHSLPIEEVLGMLDATRIEQVVWNLLSNAIKFTPKGGCVQISLTRSAQMLRLTVEDDGEGISAEFLPYVFDRFRQADSTFARTRGGLGLGLAISRQIVELHGGTIEVRSDGLGKGACFTVNLPASPPSE